MAFDVTPTSGEGPYFFTADVSDKIMYDAGYYVEFWYTAPSSVSCPLPATVSNRVATAPAPLMSTGVYRRNVAVPAGSCITYVLRLFSPAGDQLDEQSVSISNIAEP